VNPQQTRTLIGVNAGISLAHVGNYIWFPIFVATLGATASGFWAGVVMFLTYVGRLLATFFFEGTAVRLGNRATVVLAVLVEAVALGLMGFVEGVALYSLLAFFIGFGSGLSFPGLKNILGAFPEESRAKAFSTFQMACQVGALAGALAGGLFVGIDLRVLFSVVFALFLAYSLAAFLFIPGDGQRPETTPPLFNASILAGLRIGGGARYFLLSSVFWFLSISFLVGIPLHMQAYVSQWPASVPFWITGITLLALQLHTFKFMIKRFRPGQVMALAFGMMALSYLAFGAGRSAWWVVVGCFVVVFGDMLFAPAFDIWVSKRFPAERLARAMGAMHFFRSFGNMVGALAAGALYDVARVTGVPGLNWFLLVAIAVGCVVVSLASARTEATAEAKPAVAAA
jgi:DHA1 family multidrug resistance protein-like MFS transporter